MVGAAGFEPATLWSQTRCATRLRYAPSYVFIKQLLNFTTIIFILVYILFTMDSKTLTFCQVSLARDIPIIKQNYASLKKFYKDIKIYIICPKSDLDIFKKKLNYIEFNFFNEEEIISFKEFNNIFDKIYVQSFFKDKMKNRLQWYYQQILKITFIIRFIKKENKKIIIWDADTIIIKKINFFDKDYSINYGSLFENHKPYFITTQSILGYLPKYYISSLIQFICMTKKECDSFLDLLKIKDIYNEDLAINLSNIVLKNIFKIQKTYNNSLFSEYELLGISRLINKEKKQKAIFTLRSGLSGQLTKKQFFLARILNTYHVTYEHSHLNQNSKDMLNRNQNWFLFIKILIKFYLRFFFKNIVHNFKYYLNIRR